MSKKKKIIIITASLISAIFISVIITLTITVFRYLPPGHKPPRYPFKDREIIYKRNYLFQNTTKGEVKFKTDEMTVNIKKISKEEYLKSNFINVFADFHFDVYYRLNIKIKQDNKVYEAIAFQNIKKSRFERDMYFFDIQIENQVYQNVFYLRNTRFGEIYG